MDDLTKRDAKGLRALLPDLYLAAAVQGDVAARARLEQAVTLLKGLEADQPAAGFPASIDTPGQLESRVAQTRLEELLGKLPTAPEWLGLYRDLCEERKPGRPQARRWQWRTALFIAWSCAPKERRWPKTRGELASLLGCSESAFRVWRHKDPEIDERIRSLPAAMLLEHVAEVFDALTTVATMPDPKAFQDRRLFLEITGNYQPSGNLAVSMTPISYIEVAEVEDDAE